MNFRLAQKLLLAAAAATVATASSPIEILAEGCQTSAVIFDHLLNITDYAAFDMGELAGLLQQPAEVVNAWSADTREFVLNELNRELIHSLGDIDPEYQTPAAADPKNVLVGRQIRQVNEQARYRAHERSLLSLHQARVNSARSKCMQNVPCGACVVAAGFAGAAGISACIGVALEAEILTAPETFGLSTAPIWNALVGCLAKVAGVLTAAIGTCHTAL
ncbi:hypothetical protein N0V84_010941 [Fusarium piperis]|uniref:Uncharacterized protein n=1 Tax=Fusarium piperis TaxID=1435070 RepID=A0A9W8TBC4_9HYPO|nr:hypothetical protein N0V84_010941 [Fusarium piperis]